jgi:hypothetical protein
MNWGPIGDSAANLMAGGGSPGNGGAPGVGGTVIGIPPINFDQIYFYSSIQRGPETDTFEEEVQALQDETWNPATPDFRAISIRSAGWREPRADAEVNSTDKFFRMLTEPSIRFNFFGYFAQPTGTDGHIWLSGQLSSAGIGGPVDTRNGMQLQLIDQETLLRLKNMVNNNDSDPLVQVIKDIRQRNFDVRNVVRDENDKPVNRQLWLYLTTVNPDTFVTLPPGTIRDLEFLLQMEVFFFTSPIFYRPLLSLSPRDQLRGRISLEPLSDVTTDIHSLDSKGIRP